MAPTVNEGGLPLGRYNSAKEGADDPLIHKVGFPPKKTLKEEASEIYEALNPLRKYKKKGKHLTQYEKLKLAAFYVAPCLEWITSYKVDYLRGDIVGGLTIAVMAVPQDLAYAQLAKLPVVNGLYTSVYPPLIYAWFGSSRHIAVGPVAVVSLLVGSLLPKRIDPKKFPTEYLELNFLNTFYVGVIQTALGLLQLGFVIEFLSHSTIVGFMAGAAVTIGMSQLKNWLGYTTFTNKTNIQSVLKSIADHPDQFNWQTFLIGLTFLLFILFLKQVGTRFRPLWWVAPLGPLLSVVGSILFVWLTRVDKDKVRILKKVPTGMPPSSLNRLHFGNTGDVFADSLICAFIALTEAIAIGTTFATKNGYHINGNQEMFAFGLGNLVSSVTSGYVATGSFSRSSVNNYCGSNTQLTGVIMPVFIILVIMVITPSFYYIPQCVLSVIIISALVGLFDFKAAWLIWKTDKLDFVCLLGAFFGVVFKSVEIGILIAVAISVAKLIFQVTRPHTAILGRIPGTTIYRSTKQYPEASSPNGILIWRIDAPMYFANARYLKAQALRLVDEQVADEEEGGVAAHRLQFLVLDLSPVLTVDVSAALILGELHRDLHKRGIRLVLSNPNSNTLYRLEGTGLVDLVGKDWIFVRTHEAVKVCQALVESNSDINPTKNT
jgi:high affinity sulfate transporter 1